MNMISYGVQQRMDGTVKSGVEVGLGSNKGKKWESSEVDVLSSPLPSRPCLQRSRYSERRYLLSLVRN